MAGYGRRVGRSAGVHDDLAAQAIVFSDGTHKAAIVSVDVLALGLRICDSIGALVAAETDIAADAIMVCATHTHSGPQFNIFATPSVGAAGSPQRDLDWERSLPEKIARTVLEANSRLRPARIAAASAPFTFGTNRRLMRADGTMQLAPNYAGIADNELRVLGAFDASADDAIAFLLNYPCHGVVLCEDNLLYSRDWPGFAIDELERRHPGSVALFAQGASGNIDPRRRGNFDLARDAGHEAAAGAVATLEHSDQAQPPTIATRRISLRLKLRDLDARLSLARANAAQTEAALKNHAGVTGAQLKRLTDQHQRSMEELGALQVLDEANRRDKRVDQDAGELTTHMTAVTMGDIALVGVPGELFAELGIAIRVNPLFPHTFVLGYCNDLAGYFPTRAAYDQGGYEVETSRVAKGSGEVLVERALSVLSEMRLEPDTPSSTRS